MSTGFAGSRSMDERRRRRLASESLESLDDSNDDSTPASNARTNRFAAGQYPLRTLIFPKRWKLAIYYLPIFLCFSGLIAFDYYRMEWFAPESALSAYLSLEQSPLPLFLTGSLLFFSGQIALLIAALRTQSLHDFSGRHRLWKYVAGGLFLFALCMTTQLHQVWASTVIELRLFDWGPHTQLLAWLIPGLVIGFTVSLMSYLEMRGDRAGLNFTILAVATYMTYLTFSLTGNLIPWESIGTGILFFAHWSLFTSLLLHTHHLLYRSVDLPEKAPSRFKKHFAHQLHRRRIKKKARQVAKALKQKELLANRTAQQSAQKETEEVFIDAKTAEPISKSTNTSSRRKKSASVQKPETKASLPQEDSRPDPDEDLEPVPQQSARKPKSKRNMRVDNAHDPELLKGLSKRERRKLQKQWREEERQNAQRNREDYS
ncbi:MAG: hypothetical protein P1V19_16440 [Gimesia sp.]|nr:hypothetical protein [Gimesia sp.]